MNDCIFCKIVKGDMDSEKLFENESIIAIKDIKPSAPVHYLIIPKKHVESIAHLDGEHKEIVSEIIFVAKELADKEGLKGYKLVFNVGREGGQIIDHLHLHLLGGWSKQSDIDSMPHEAR